MRHTKRRSSESQAVGGGVVCGTITPLPSRSSPPTSSWGSDLSGLKLVEDKAKGWKWRVSKKDEKAVRGLPGVSAGDIIVLKDGIYFSNARLERAAEKLEAIDADYVTAQGEIVKVALEQALTYLPVLEATASIVSELDAYAGMAHVVSSSAGQYTLPVFVEAGEGTGAGAGAGAASGEPPRRCLRVKGGRHPIIEMGEDVSFIANDYDLLGAAPDEAPWAEGGAASEAVASPATKRPRVAAAAAGAEDMSMQPCRFNIVTGPNMGGKSTYIRTLGVLAVMAQVRGGGYLCSVKRFVSHPAPPLPRTCTPSPALPSPDGLVCVCRQHGDDSA